MTPDVSVILPVRNGGAHIRPAVESILGQEGVPFELLVVDDGSSDGTPAYLAGIADPRLRVLRLEGGGLVAALNAGAVASSAPLLARMDADDIALPGRLARQAALLRDDSGTAITFSGAYLIDEAGRRTGTIEAESLSREERRAVLLDERGGPPIIHPSVMMRRSMLEALGGYRESVAAEDHDLWLRAIDRYGFTPIRRPLLEYRHHGHGVSRQRAVEQNVSHLMNIVCYRLRAARGIDLFADRPELYARVRAWSLTEFELLLRNIAAARQIRSGLKRGPRAASIRQLARSGKSVGPVLRISRARLALRQCEGRMLDRIEAELASDARSPVS